MNRRKFLESSSMMLSAGALGAAAGAPQSSKPGKKYRLIATEEAFASPEQLESFRHEAASMWHDPDVNMWRTFLANETLLRRLLDFEKERLGIMDQFGVDIYILSLTAPGVQLLDAGAPLAASANDLLAEAVKKHPTRYAGLASFAPQDPKRAATEIERALNTLKTEWPHRQFPY